MKSLIFKTAWSLFKSNIFVNFSEALKAAWKFYKTKAALKNSIVNLTFRKSNGEITTRKATLQDGYFPESKGSIRAPKAGLITFWSITDGGFRACRIERLLKVA